MTVPYTKCLCNLNLCKPNTCLNWTNSSVPQGFGLDRFDCNIFCSYFQNSYYYYYDFHCYYKSIVNEDWVNIDVTRFTSEDIEESCIRIRKFSAVRRERMWPTTQRQTTVDWPCFWNTKKGLLKRNNFT